MVDGGFDSGKEGGGMIGLGALPHTESSAVFSEDGCYRYLLTQHWGNGPLVGLIGLNPSTADEHRHDPGSRQFRSFAKSWGFSGYTAGNLYAGVCPDPKSLDEVADPVGPDNDAYIDRIAATHDMIVFAWGVNANPGRARAVASRIWSQCRRCGGAVAVLGWTANDQPRHPLNVRADTRLQTLTAGSHPGFIDVDPRWSQLLADTTDLDSVSLPVTGVVAMNGGPN
jgi:hypothetical protein